MFGVLPGNREHFLNLGKMGNILGGGCTNSDFLLNVKRNVIRFKAGSELSSSVNRIDVTVDEDITNEAHEMKISLVLKSERCSK